VVFQSTVLRPIGNNLALATGGASGGQTEMPVILSASQTVVLSNASGLASFTPSLGSFTGTLEVEIQVSAGTTATLQDVMESFPETYFGSDSAPSSNSVPRAIAPMPVGLPARPARIEF
jgi:hypothetical protein